jgi:large conductance mechanosensitive channel
VLLRQLIRLLLSRSVIELAAAIILGIACVSLLQEVARVVVSVVAQLTVDDDSALSGLVTFSVGDTVVYYGEVLKWLLAGLLGAGVVALLLRHTAQGMRECPECLSTIPTEAAVCRYSSSDLAPGALEGETA